jgi:hypothetical protein
MENHKRIDKPHLLKTIGPDKFKTSSPQRRKERKGNHKGKITEDFNLLIPTFLEGVSSSPPLGERIEVRGEWIESPLEPAAHGQNHQRELNADQEQLNGDQ